MAAILPRLNELIKFWHVKQLFRRQRKTTNWNHFNWSHFWARLVWIYPMCSSAIINALFVIHVHKIFILPATVYLSGMKMAYHRIVVSPLLTNWIYHRLKVPQIAKFMCPTWGPPGSCRPQMGPMLSPWPLLSGTFCVQAVLIISPHISKLVSVAKMQQRSQLVFFTRQKLFVDVIVTRR